MYSTGRRISRRCLHLAILLAMVLTSLGGMVQSVQAAPSDLFFSEYIEGSSNNKALEIYNGTGAAIDLSASGYNILMYFNGSPSAGLTIALNGTVANGDVFVVAQSTADPAILAQADLTNSSGWFNGDDAVVLRKGTTVLDVIGQIGTDPGTEWGAGLTSTADNTLRRKGTVAAGDPDGTNPFDPSLEWNGFASNTFDGLGSHSLVSGDTAPAVMSTNPANGANNVPTNASLTVTFTELVNVTGTWYDLTCSTSGSLTAVVSGGPTTFTIDPNLDFVPGESCTFTLIAANITDQDSNDPPDTMAADFTLGFTPEDVCSQPYTPAYEIQGSGAAAAITGPITTQGVVVGDYEGPSPALRGFYLQDLTGDGNATTSDGLFIFEGNNANRVQLGDLVRVTGSAEEYQDQTQVSASSVSKCGTGSVEPVEVTLPASSTAYLEQFEGMLVSLPQTLYVTEIYQLGRFGQVTLSSGGRLQQPTNVVAPGSAAQEMQAQNDLNAIILDDASQVQNPDPILFGRGGQPLSASNTLRGGDTVTGIVGLMTYTWAGHRDSGNAYRVRPVNALGATIPSFQAANPRPSSAPAPSGSLRVTGMNLLNYFNTFDGASDDPPYACNYGLGGELTDCRGADDPAEFERQWPKTVAAILGTGADVIGIIEVENDGYGPDSALQNLVNQLNAATAPGTFAFINADANTAQINALGTDAIKVGLLYRPARVTPIGQTAVLNSIEFVNGDDGEPRNRPALTQAFEQNADGARFVVSVNHLKSKGSPCDAPDTGDGQGNCSLVRTNAAQLLAAWLASDPTGTGEPDTLILGDLNSNALEDPITVLRNAGYTNLIATFIGPDAYSYVFDGQWGYLDHALSSASLAAQVTGVADWHINADEPIVLDYNVNFKNTGQLTSLYAPDYFRASDHDPVLVDLNLTNATPTASAGGPYNANEGETVALSASGLDPENTPVTFAWDLDNNGSFETPGQTVDFNALDGPGSYSVSVQVTDTWEQSTTASALVNVTNLPPVAGPISGLEAPVLAGTAAQASASFTDAGILDTHTGVWDWGDGTTSAATVTEANGSGTSSDSHTYTTPGVYPISLTVTDKDGGSSQSFYESMVVYNPEGGFVTGGGWFSSPAGALIAAPDLASKAEFSFSAKYRKKAAVPTGEVAFTLPDAGFAFASNSLDWLVVKQDRTSAQFRGTGTINGAGSYHFMIWITDGRPDAFRIRIWSLGSNGEQVVYDNNSLQAIEGGSIVFHQ